jgi:hypothetical protein
MTLVEEVFDRNHCTNPRQKTCSQRIVHLIKESGDVGRGTFVFNSDIVQEPAVHIETK